MFDLWKVGVLCIVGALSVLTGCAGNPKNPADPFEKSNRFFYSFNEGLDRYALKPAADFYVKVIPTPIRTGLGNGYDNLAYGDTILNDFLQAKWHQGLGDLGRMAANSTLGIAGFLDVATPMGLAKHDNDFGITLAQWGAGQGPYLVLPVVGSQTLRDAPDLGTQLVTNPIFWINLPWYVSLPVSGVGIIDFRARGEGWVRFRGVAALDPYVFTRDAYLQYRQNKIRGGKPPTDSSIYDELDEPLIPPSTQPTSAATQPR